MWLDRALALLDADDDGDQRAKLRVFELVFVCALVAEFWCRALPKWGLLPANYQLSLALATLVGPLALSAHWRRPALLLLAANSASVSWHEFPAAANHSYLQVTFCLLGATCSLEEHADRVLYLRALRWIVVVVFVASGVQKLVHGYYFHGTQLAFLLGTESYRPVLRPLLPEPEFARLAGYTRQVGDGPYRVDSRLFLLVSNAVYVLEIGLPLLLLIPRTRTLAVAGLLALMVAIEAGAREFVFGLTFLNGVLLFLPRDLNRRLAPLFLAAIAYLLLVAVGVMPYMRFT